MIASGKVTRFWDTFLRFFAKKLERTVQIQKTPDP